MFYYGTEAGMWGGNDPDVRQPMVWPDLKYAPQAIDPRGHDRKPDPVEFDRPLFNYYQRVIGLRRSLPVLNHGRFRFLGAFDAQQAVVFIREMEAPPAGTPGRVVVAINRSEAPQQIEVAGGPPGAGWKLLTASRDDLPPGSLSLASVGQQWVFRLPPLTAGVWAEEPPSQP
jgi:glycosidase